MSLLHCRSGGGLLFKLLGLTVIGAGGACGYAWYDQEFRKTVQSNVPYSKDAFDAIMGPTKESTAAAKPAPK